MTLILEASCISLNDVHRLLKLQEQVGGAFTELLSFELITEIEQQDLLRIRNDFLTSMSIILI